MFPQSKESRWFWIPGIFGALLFVSFVVRWLPAAIFHSHSPFGLAQVAVGDMSLAWRSFLRCAVAYIVTALALDYLPPIRWRHVMAIAATAVVMEILAELATADLFGAHAATWVQLVATTMAYSLVLALGMAAIRMWALR
jgi:hypothetical protein